MAFPEGHFSLLGPSGQPDNAEPGSGGAMEGTGRARAPVPADALLAATTDLLTLHDRDGTVVFASAASQTLLGVEAEQLVGRQLWQLVHPEDRRALRDRWLRLAGEPGAVDQLTLRLRHVDGEDRYVEIGARNVLHDPGLKGLLLSTRDITGRGRAEQSVRRSEGRLRRLVATAPVGLSVVDGDGRVRFANPAALAVTGLASLDDLLGHRVSDLVVPADRARCSAALHEAIQTRVAPGPGEYRLLRPGEVDTVVSSAPLPFDWDGTPAALLVLQDVTLLRRAQDERALATERLERILEATAEGIVGLDAEGRVSFLNPAAAQQLLLDPVEVLGRPAHQLYHHSRADGTPYPELDCPCLRAVRTGRATEASELVFWRADGTSFPVEIHATPFDEEAGAVLAFHDVSERARTRVRLARLAAFQGAVLDALPSLTAVVDAQGVIVAVNAAWVHNGELNGADPAGCGTGADVLAVCDATTGPDAPGARAVADGLRRLLAGQLTQYQQDVPCHGPAGDTQHYSLTVVPLHAQDGGAVLAYSDITVRKLGEVEARHRATHDLLTGLVNRTLLMERLAHALTARGVPSVGLLFLDLDGFKLVNDRYGHDAGDAVLLQVADRLREHVRPADTVARLSGDEFVVLCEELALPTEAHLLAERLLAALREPFTYGGGSLTVGASIGIALASDTEPGAPALLRAADQAMSDAKAAGRNRLMVFDAGKHGHHRVRIQQSLALRRLVEQDELLVHYQPIIELATGRVTGAEALLRWRGNTDLPDTATAVELAEEIGLATQIGEFVLREATRQAMTFRRQGGPPLPLALNLSARQLRPELVSQVERAARDTSYPLTSLTLELTEQAILVDPVTTVEVLTALRDRGVRVALDHFGVGYCSLSALTALPLDALKMDMTFVHALTGPSPDARIVTAVIELGRVLELDVTANGIELPGQRAALLALGCHQGQGYLFSAARPASELDAVLT